LAIRPESLHASDEPGSGRNRFEGILEKAIFSGDSVDCQVKAGDRSVHAKVSSETFDAETGGRVCLEFDATSCMVLAAEADKILND